ncbi:MAG: ATP-binding protein [Deltaproteobacteria bacterium]|nr:ATP-binding protein [Deltaproteobacteria bacterium]
MRLHKTDLAVYGLVALVMAASAWWVHLRWQAQLRSGRAQMLAQLLATSHAPRMVETPGVEAWLLELLHEAGTRLPASERRAYEQLLRPRGATGLPDGMQPLVQRLHVVAPSGQPSPATVQEVRSGPQPDAAHRQSLRAVGHVQVAGRTLVLTRRRSAFERGALPDDLAQAAAHLVALSEAWPSSVSAAGRLIRLYAIAEDGSFLSLPIPEGEPSPDALARTVAEETVQSQRRPRAPSLVTNSMFLEFDYGEPLDTQAHYSGVYTDIAGSGFVASLSVPAVYEGGGLKMVIAADLAVDVPLDRLLEAADPSMQLALTAPVRELRTPMWQPWTTLGASLPPDAPGALRREVQLRANLEAHEDTWVPRGSLVHHTPEDERGVLLGLQVSRRRWLVGWLAEDTASVPWVPLLLGPGLLVGLLAWTRRRGARLLAQRDDARVRLEQRHGVLDLLHLPLVVVDPNDDTVVQANAAATELGVVPGRIFHEHLVADQTRSQRYYQTMQVLEGGRRRAYGVHLRPRPGETEGRFALIRSVSLSEPQPGLGAAAHHRLGLVCVIDDEADLSHFLHDHLHDARQDERNKLASIVTHGADTLARVLAATLAEPHDDGALPQWLASYLLRRLHVSQWVLDRWGGPVCHDVSSILGPEHISGALAQYEQIFATVAQRAALRARLHWNNGTLSTPRPGGGPVVEVWIDWPPQYRVTAPAEGLFGYLLGEALTNAVKHGAPGQPITLEVDLDRGRRELCLSLRNAITAAPDAPREAERDDKAYGGLAIASELARICGWSLETTTKDESFELRWSCAVTQQRGDAQVD